jgi:predicted metal-binding membrane protein
MGAEHGSYCVGCCWGLMLILFALGVMSITWMLLVTAAIFAQKVLPWGPVRHRVSALALLGFGIWIAINPTSVPGLTLPM